MIRSRLVFSCGAQAGTSICQQNSHVLRRYARYQDLLNRLRVPHPGVMYINGKELGLPYRVGDCALDRGETIDPVRLKSLATSLGTGSWIGFMGGGARCYAAIISSRSIYNTKMLVELADCFGGSFNVKYYRLKPTWKPSVRWIITGEAACRAARVLASVPSVNQTALKTLDDSQCASMKRRFELKSPGAVKPESYVIESWESAAGLIDVKGYVGATSGCPVVRISSVRRELLDALVLFLKSQELSSGSVLSHPHKRSSSYFRWEIRGFDHFRQLMSRMLPYLCQRKDFIKHVLDLDPPNALAALRQPHLDRGNQHYFDRLDIAGDDYARILNQSRIKLYSLRKKNRSGFKDDSANKALEEMLEAEVEVAKSTHRIHMLNLNVRRSRDLIRDVLSRGATIEPTKSRRKKTSNT